MPEKIKSLVQPELKRVKKLIAILSIVAILTSIINVASIYQYNQLANKEKAFLKQAGTILSKIDTHSHFEE